MRQNPTHSINFFTPKDNTRLLFLVAIGLTLIIDLNGILHAISSVRLNNQQTRTDNRGTLGETSQVVLALYSFRHTEMIQWHRN